MELRNIGYPLVFVCIGVLFAPVHAGGQSAHAAGPPPSIRTIVAPPPNAHGWNNSDVSITFECRRAVSCPDPVVVHSDGANQRVVRSVTDAYGRTAEVSAVVNVDKTAGRVEISRTHSSAPTVLTITAHASDPLSGVASAFCNGRPARLMDTRIECEVPFREGLTDVVVSVLDRAGNSASAGTQLARAATSPHILVFPRTATIRVGDTRALYLLDSAWQRVPSLRWPSDNPAVARVDATTGAVTGVTEGETTIAGWSDDSRSAAMTLIVIAERHLPLGTTVWAGHEVPGTVVGRPLPPPRDQQSTMGTQLDAAGNLSVASVRLTGEPLWFTLTAVAPGERVHTEMTDNSGSPLLWADGGGGRSAIVRTGRPTEGRLWRYELDSSATGFWALGWDGTLWVIETPRSGYPHVTALDYLTGEVKFRIGVPLTVTPRTTTVNDDAIARPSIVGPGFVPDGHEVAIPYAVTEVRPAAAEGEAPRVRAMRRVYIMRVTPDGKARVEGLLGFTSPTVEALPALRLGQLCPDGAGGLLALMQATYPDGRSHGWVMRRSGEDRTMYPLPVARDYVLGEDQAYTTDGSTLVAFDPVSGKVNWTRRSEEPLQLYFATKGGGVIVRMRNGTYRVLSDGTLQLVVPQASVPVHR